MLYSNLFFQSTFRLSRIQCSLYLLLVQNFEGRTWNTSHVPFSWNTCSWNSCRWNTGSWNVFSWSQTWSSHFNILRVKWSRSWNTSLVPFHICSWWSSTSTNILLWSQLYFVYRGDGETNYVNKRQAWWRTRGKRKERGREKYDEKGNTSGWGISRSLWTN